MATPDWWPQVEPEVDAVVEGFAAWVREKVVTEPSHRLIEKNPYLFCARALDSAEELAERMVDAFLSSSEETHFGGILEDIAVAVCRAAKGGSKSSSEGIDLEYDGDVARTLVQVKSSTKWGNSGQHKRLVSVFQAATRRLRQGGVAVRCVEGICYGPSGSVDKGSHVRLVGKDFWHDITGWRGVGKRILRTVERHACNGLADVRAAARENMVDYLRRTGCTSKGGRIRWGKVYDVIMTPTRERPR